MPALADILQYLYHYTALEHEGMIRAFYHFDLTPIPTHRVLHPPNSILRYSLVSIAIPNANRMGIIRV